MKTASQNYGHLTAKGTREIISPFETEVLIHTLVIDPTIKDVQITYKWLHLDEHLVRGVDIELTGKVGTIYELLDAEFPGFDVSGRGAQVPLATVYRTHTEREAVMVSDIMYVVRLKSPRRTDVPQVGGKNASLGEMLANLAGWDVNVSSDFALTADAFRQSTEVNDLQPVIFPALTSLDDSKLPLAETGPIIRRAMPHSEWPKETTRVIRLAYDELNHRTG